MKVQLSSIVEGIEFQGLESCSYLNLQTGEIILIADEEIHAVENDYDVSDQAEWYKEAIASAREFLENQDQYLELPTKYELNEYRIIENFVYSIPIEEQREEMLDRIRGKGAFSQFKQGIERFLLMDKWYKYRDSEIKKFAEEWCQENNIQYENESEYKT
jgi:hypothetical protein